MILRKLVTGLIATALLSGGSIALSTTPALACIIDDATGRCVVIGPTVSGSPNTTAGVNARQWPNENSAKIGFLPYGASGTVYCWSYGDPGSAYQYWDFTGVPGHLGFIADRYLFTGGDITTQVNQCDPGTKGF